MSKYTLFRDRTQIETNISQSAASEFIEKSLSSTEVYDVRNDTIIKAVLTRDHKEGNDEIILFTYLSEALEENLVVGDYIEHKNKKYFIFMQFDHPLQQKYLKYKIIECNIVVRFDEFERPAAYFSSLRSFTNLIFKNYGKLSAGIEDTKPIIVIPDDTELKVNKRFLAAQEGFKIISIDRITNKGIAYLSIQQAPYNAFENEKTTKIAINPAPPTVDVPLQFLRKGSTIAISIVNGYVVFEPLIKIITKTLTTVTFKVPFDINSLKITTKDIDENIIEKIYEVV